MTGGWKRGHRDSDGGIVRRSDNVRQDDDVRRGDIWTANFGSANSDDISGVRFVIVVSNDPANRHSKRIQVVPIGDHSGRAYPCEAVITIKRSRQQKALSDRIQTIAKDCLISRLQSVGQLDMSDVDRAILLQLGLSPRRST